MHAIKYGKVDRHIIDKADTCLTVHSTQQPRYVYTCACTNLLDTSNQLTNHLHYTPHFQHLASACAVLLAPAI